MVWRASHADLRRRVGIDCNNIASVLRHLEWAGEHCQHLMNRQFRNLTLNHLECIEIWTFVGKKQARLTETENVATGNIGDIYLGYGIDQQTKLIPALVLGNRSADMARRLILAVATNFLAITLRTFTLSSRSDTSRSRRFRPIALPVIPKPLTSPSVPASTTDNA